MFLIKWYSMAVHEDGAEVASFNPLNQVYVFNS